MSKNVKDMVGLLSTKLLEIQYKISKHKSMNISCTALKRDEEIYKKVIAIVESWNGGITRTEIEEHVDFHLRNQSKITKRVVCDVIMCFLVKKKIYLDQQ